MSVQPRRKKQRTTKANANRLFLVWKVEVTYERYDSVEQRELYAVRKSRAAAEACEETIKSEVLEDGLDWEEEGADDGMEVGSVYYYADIEEQACPFPSTTRKVWVVLKTTEQEGQGWCGTHQYEYDHETVEVIGIYDHKRHADGAAEDGNNDLGDQDDYANELRHYEEYSVEHFVL